MSRCPTAHSKTSLLNTLESPLFNCGYIAVNRHDLDHIDDLGLANLQKWQIILLSDGCQRLVAADDMMSDVNLAIEFNS